MRQPHGPLEYYLTTEIHLSLEMFHNEGLTPEESRKAIEDCTDVNGSHFYCTPGGVNRNWTISTRSRDAGTIKMLVSNIEWALRRALNTKYPPKETPDVAASGAP
jgi:hypothetical protein